MGMLVDKTNRLEWQQYVKDNVLADQYYILIYSPVTKMSDVLAAYDKEGDPCYDEATAVETLKQLFIKANANNIINNPIYH